MKVTTKIFNLLARWHDNLHVKSSTLFEIYIYMFHANTKMPVLEDRTLFETIEYLKDLMDTEHLKSINEINEYLDRRNVGMREFVHDMMKRVDNETEVAKNEEAKVPLVNDIDAVKSCIVPALYYRESKISPRTPAPIDNILVIDELPIIPLAFQEVFRIVNQSAVVEYSENIFSALSCRDFANRGFDLVITGSFQENYSEHLQQAIIEIKRKFGNPRVMVYSASYDPMIVQKMEEAGIDAYVHKFEPIGEIKKAYSRLCAGDTYLSELFHALYYERDGVRR